VLLDGRLTLGAQVAISAAPRDEQGFFNYTAYEHDALRLFRAGVSGALRAGEQVMLVGEIRADTDPTASSWGARAHALYLRVVPWRGRTVDVQAGIIPPTFGAFGRRSYGRENPLIGYPLAYQYLTSVRADAIPATADDLLEMRGRGWLASYPVGNPRPEAGLPVIEGQQWDTGLRARVGSRSVELAAAVTAGTLSNPRRRDDNPGRQVVARLALQPATGLLLGLSVAHGRFVADSVARALPDSRPARHSVQRAIGLDAEYSRDHWLLRAEAIVNEWRLPPVSEPGLAPLRVVSLDVEGRYTLRPGLYAAARLSGLGFSPLTGSAERLPWDANVARTELGVGYSFQRNVLGKVVYQRNWRDGGYRRSMQTASAQLLYWF
jgi:hypothetical protein